MVARAERQEEQCGTERQKETDRETWRTGVGKRHTHTHTHTHTRTHMRAQRRWVERERERDM
jgi:hypothetical protein